MTKWKAKLGSAVGKFSYWLDGIAFKLEEESALAQPKKQEEEEEEFYTAYDFWSKKR